MIGLLNHKHRSTILILVIATLAIVDGLIYLRHIAKPSTVKPVSSPVLTSGADFPALYPHGLPVQGGQYDKTRRVITYHTEMTSMKFVVTEQPYPDTLIYEKLLTSLNPADNLTIKSGTVTFIKPKDVSSGQTVVGHLGDLLMFVHTDSNPTTEQWQSLFAMMELHL